MKILVMIDVDNSLDFDVSSDFPLQDLKALLEAETGIPPDQMLLIHKTVPLNEDEKGLDELGVCDGDIIMLNSTTAGVIPSSSQANTTQQDRHYAQLQPSTMPQINWGSVVIPPNVASSISRTSTASSYFKWYSIQAYRQHAPHGIIKMFLLTVKLAFVDLYFCELWISKI